MKQASAHVASNRKSVDGRVRAKRVPTSAVVEAEPIVIRSIDEAANLVSPYGNQTLVLFRGHTSTRELLLPTIGRPEFSHLADYFETTAFADFRKLAADKLSLLAVPPTSDLEWLAVARHSGLPSRLLDWTTNPLVALYFATMRPKLEMQEDDAVIWVFAPPPECEIDKNVEDQPLNVNRTRVFWLAPVHSRMRAQHAFFSIHPRSEGSPMVPLDEIEAFKRPRFRTEQGGSVPCLRKALVPRGIADELHRRLNVCGFNDATLFPDLDHLVAQLKMQPEYSGSLTNPPPRKSKA